jgi:catechol 2,3-dioxygenase-like lactoylglutathione lyase family enzyme
VTRFIHTMLRLVEPEKTIAFYEALGFEFRREFPIVRGGVLDRNGRPTLCGRVAACSRSYETQ